MFGLFESVEEKDKETAIHTIIENASPRRDFFLLVMLSVAMASFGVLIDSTIVLIGSMLIAPILYPVLSLALGVTTVDKKLIVRSIITIARASSFAIIAGAVITLLFSTTDVHRLTVLGTLAPTSPSLAYAFIAGISGFAAAFALVKPNLSEVLPGVAISVSLLPPVTIIGIGLASFDAEVALGAASVYLVNIIGIVLSAMFVFVMVKLPRKHEAVSSAVRETENEVAAEKAAQ